MVTRHPEKRSRVRAGEINRIRVTIRHPHGSDGMPSMTPTGRTLVSLRRAGFMADICERWIPHANIRRDLYGLADVLAVHPTRREFLLVQATSAGHVGDRLARARSRPELGAWLRAGGRFEVWGLGQTRRPLVLQARGDSGRAPRRGLGNRDRAPAREQTARPLRCPARRDLTRDRLCAYVC